MNEISFKNAQFLKYFEYIFKVLFYQISTFLTVLSVNKPQNSHIFTFSYLIRIRNLELSCRLH